MEDAISAGHALAVNVSPALFADLQEAAAYSHQTVSEYVERILTEVVRRPNPETIEAIRQARSGIGMKEADMSSFESFMASVCE